MKHNDPKYTICYNAKRYCNQDISLIENYDQMIADYTQKWCCHHRREIDEHKSASQLIAEGHYYKVPACELIFMTVSDHMALHAEDVTWKENISKATKEAMNRPEVIKKISDTMTGVPKSEEHRRNIGEAKKGTKWWNNGTKNVQARECPEGYGPGMLKRVAATNATTHAATT